MSVSPYSSVALVRSATYFLSGKAASALLTFILLLWLVRLLPLEEYGVYVALVAGMELVIPITSLGLPWVAVRFIPEFRLYASGIKLAQFIWQILARLGGFLVVGALLLLALMPWALISLQLTPYAAAAKLYLLVVIMEGLGRSIRDHILGPLLQQRSAQISFVIRNTVMLLLISILVLQGPVHLNEVILAELAASTVGTIMAFRAMICYQLAHRDLPGKEGWQPQSWPERWSMGRHMYFNQLIAMTYSPQAFVFLIQRYVGVEGTALFGFLRSLYTQIAGYLPAALLFGLIRPKLIASYVGEGGIAELTRNANLAGKLSLFALMPILIFFWLDNGELLSLLSGGKFNGAGYYLAALLLTLVPLSQRHILETVAVVNDLSYVCTWGSVAAALALPLAYVLIESGHGLWAPIIGMIVGQLLFQATIMIAVTRATAYRPDIIGFMKLSASALTAFLMTQLLVMVVPTATPALPALLFNAALSFGLYLLVSYLIKPFSDGERSRLNRVVGRRVFIW